MYPIQRRALPKNWGCELSEFMFRAGGEAPVLSIKKKFNIGTKPPPEIREFIAKHLPP